MNVEILSWIPPLAYGGAALLYLRRLLSEAGPSSRSLPLAEGALVLHALVVAVLWIVRGRPPFGTMAEAASFGSLVLAGSYLLVQRLARTESMGAFFCVPLSFATVFQAWFPGPPRWPVRLQSTLFALHASLGVAALALLSASALLAVVYLRQYRSLERRQFGLLARRLPDLATLDRFQTVCLSVGTVLLAAATAAGVAWIVAWEIPVRAAGWKAALVLGALAYHAAIPLLRRRPGFTGRTAARMGVASLLWVVLVLLAGSHGG